jgi:8-oxo-dGTP pyrophosphatase MutT (NUDIX family)
MHDEERVGAVVRELFEETGRALTADDLTMSRGEDVYVPLPDSKMQHVYEYDASALTPYGTNQLRKPLKVEQDVTAQSTVQPDSSYVVPTSITLAGLNVTRFVT